MHKNSHHEQAVPDKKRFYHFYQPLCLTDLPISDGASDVEVGNNKQDEGGGQEEDRADEESFIELFVGTLVVSCQALHDPEREVAGVDEGGERGEDEDEVAAAVGVGELADRGQGFGQRGLLGLVDDVVVFGAVAEEVEEGDGEGKNAGEDRHRCEYLLAALN